MAFGKGHHLHLIDGSGFIFRAYHALPPLTRKSDGLPVGAVSGFCNMLFKIIEDQKGSNAPTHLVVVFDAKGKTFRSDIYPEYKMNRPPAPEDLVPQFPLTRDATRAFGLACIEQEGFEADDIMATLAIQARDAGGHVTIVSSDKDLMQLVGNGVEMYDAMKNKRIGSEQVVEKFGVGPNRVIDVQSLAGDSVDNVPGAPGIGIKTAALLINEYGIPEPTSDEVVFPSILLVPLVAFDKHRNRIGYGGGFYDRYIKKIKKNKKIVTIGLAYSFQKIREVPTNQYDISLDFILTEKN